MDSKINHALQAPADNWACILTAVNARAEYLRAELRLAHEAPWQGMYDDWDHPAMELPRGLARLAALQAAKPVRMPALIADIEVLAIEFWSVIEGLRERQSAAAAEAQHIERCQARAALAEHGDWVGLDLPSPSDLATALLAGKSMTVANHSLSYEQELGVTWVTNPYGIDAVFCNEPTEAALATFLKHMAEGKDYGAIP